VFTNGLKKLLFLNANAFERFSFQNKKIPIMPETQRLCLSCGEPLKGRSDKKFCDDYCRNAYHNNLNSDENNFVRNVNNILRRNRRILEQLIPQGQETGNASKTKLLEKGFQFKYLTDILKTQKGKTYYFCYEYGYLPLSNDWFTIVKKNVSNESGHH
jgi:hypothetical protein